MLPGQQRKSSEGEPDDDRQLKYSVSPVDPSIKYNSGQRINERVALQRPVSPRLLSPQHDSARSFDLQRINSLDAAFPVLNASSDNSRDTYEQDSIHHKRVTKLKRPHTSRANHDSIVSPPFITRAYNSSEETAPSTSAAVSTIRKRENRSNSGGNERGSWNYNLGIDDKNSRGLARGRLDSPNSNQQHSPLPMAATSNRMLNDKLEIEMGKTPAGLESGKQYQMELRRQDDDPHDPSKNQQFAPPNDNERIHCAIDTKGGARGLNRQDNVDRGGGRRDEYEHGIETLARKLKGRRRKTGASRGNWSAGLNEQWRKEGKSIVVLISLGVCGSTIDAAIDFSIRNLNDLSNLLVTSVPNSSRFVEYVLFTLYMVLGTSIAVALTALVAPDVSGSGLPLMKWIIGTDGIPRKLSKRFTVRSGVVKVVGLSLGAGVGLNIGREGPFVHISGILAYQLMSCISWFHDILDNESLLRQVLVSSTSLGIGSTFAAMIGGVLFTIEITSTFYLVAQYFKGFVAGVAGAVAVTTLSSILRTENSKAPFVETNFTVDSFDLYELPIFAFLGCICGFFGPLYGQSKLLALRICRHAGLWSKRNDRDFRWPFVLRSIGVGILVAFVSATLTFWPGHFNQLEPFKALEDLFIDGEDLPDYWNSGFGGVRMALFTSFIVRWVTAVLATSIVLPAGDFILTTVCGASFGRLCGTLILRTNLGTYAFVGGAALSAAATQSVSSAVIVMELTGGFILKLPTLLAVVISVGVSRKLGKNIYDCVVDCNNLSSLQGLNIPHSVLNKCACDMMVTDIPVVPSIVTHGQILDVLGKLSHRLYVPVVSRKEDMIFLGVVDKRDLVKLVYRKGQNNAQFMSHIQSQNMNPDVKNSVLGFEQQPVWSISGAITGMWGSIMQTTRRSVMTGTDDVSELPHKRKLTRVTLKALQESGWEESDLEGAILKQVLDEEIDLIYEDEEGNVFIDADAWSIPESIPVSHIHVLFELLRATELYVVIGGQLRGIVTRDSFMDVIVANQEHQVLTIRSMRTFEESDSDSSSSSSSLM